MVTMSNVAFGLDSKGTNSMGFARITQIDASPRPKVAQFLRSCLNAGGGPSGPAENGTNVLRTPKYNKPQGKVKHNLSPICYPDYHPGTAPAVASKIGWQNVRQLYSCYWVGQRFTAAKRNHSRQLVQNSLRIRGSL
jgi:hypothetical protein